jgi:hypothetical protein
LVAICGVVDFPNGAEGHVLLASVLTNEPKSQIDELFRGKSVENQSTDFK